MNESNSERGAKRSVTHHWSDYLFIAPAAIFLLLFMVFPLIFNVLMSFRDVQASTLLNFNAPWVGLANYNKVFENPTFWPTVRNTVVFTALSLLFQVGLGLALAVFYTRNFPGATYMRGLFLIAWTIPVVVSAAVFRWLLDAETGVINYVLQSLGLIKENIQWLADARYSLLATIIVNIWLGIPFNLVLLVAALQTVPKSLYEASSIDGASRFQTFRFVTLPLILPALLSVVMLGLIYTFKVFDVVYVTTQGGPLDASQVISTLAYKLTFSQFRFGEGAAMLNLLFLVLFVLSLLYLRSVNRESA